MHLGSRLRAFGVAALVATALIVGSRQAGCHGTYASNAAYRAQVDAFLHGRLALSRVPEGLAHDLAWTESGTQQVWGLGVPLWQTPFEVGARAVGADPFPDRIAMIAWLALVGFVLLRAFRRREGEPWWLGPGCALIVGLLPALVTLIRGRLGIYEEAAIYAYGAGAMLLGGVVALARMPSPTRTRYLVLLAAAGLTGLIRPTVWFYGLATAVIATAIYLRAHGRRALPIVALGAALFLAGGGALYATNRARFGAGTEFGHRLNIEALPGNVYATRFGYPFQRAGWIEATTELVGSLFDRPEQFKRRGWYLPDLHHGQSERVRWREYYFTTYSWPYVPLLLGGLLLGVLAWRRRARTEGDGDGARWLVAWAVIGALPLFVFYLRSPSMSSRYQLDFAPAFAALLVIAWRAGGAWIARHGRGVIAPIALVAVWSIAILTSSRRARVPLDPVGRDKAESSLALLASPKASPRELPAAYDLTDPKLRTWIAPAGEVVGDPEGPPLLYLNALGWNPVTGSVPPATHFYISDPQFLELEVETTSGAQVDWPANVRVAVDLQHPALTSVTPTPRGARLRFSLAAPRHGLHVAFVAFGPDTGIDRLTSDFVLRSIRWRQ